MRLHTALPQVEGTVSLSLHMSFLSRVRSLVPPGQLQWTRRPCVCLCGFVKDGERGSECVCVCEMLCGFVKEPVWGMCV